MGFSKLKGKISSKFNQSVDYQEPPSSYVNPEIAYGPACGSSHPYNASTSTPYQPHPPYQQLYQQPPYYCPPTPALDQLNQAYYPGSTYHSACSSPTMSHAMNIDPASSGMPYQQITYQAPPSDSLCISRDSPTLTAVTAHSEAGAPLLDTTERDHGTLAAKDGALGNALATPNAENRK